MKINKKPIGFIADTHIHPHKSHATIVGAWNTRLLYTIEAISKAGEILLDRGGEALVIAGDVFHVRGSIRPSTLNLFATTLTAMTAIGLKIIIIPGNHDMENLSGGDTSVDILNSIPGVFVYRNPTSILISGWNMMAIPYQHSSSNFKEILSNLPFGIEVIACHQGVDDFKPYAAMVDTGITVKGIESAYNGWLFAGHYHNARGSGKVTSIGSIVQNDFSSEGEARGMWILNPDDSTDFIPIDSPKFVTIKAGDKINKDDVDGNYCRIIAKTTKAAQKTFDALKEAGAKSIVTHLEREFVGAKQDSIMISNPEDMICKYIDIQSPKYDARKAALLDMYRGLI